MCMNGPCVSPKAYRDGRRGDLGIFGAASDIPNEVFAVK